VSGGPFFITTRLRWPRQQPGNVNVDYSIRLSDYLVCAPGSVVQSAAISNAPSGTGEISISSLSVGGGLITALLTGGVPGRSYTFKLDVTLNTSQVLEFIIQLFVSSAIGIGIQQLAPSEGFSTPVTWTGPTEVIPVQEGLVGTGTGQSTALLLPAYVNEITSAPPGTAFILNPNIGSGASFGVGTQAVQNDDPANPAVIYPPLGAYIIAGGTVLAVNTPFVLGPAGLRQSFSTEDAAVQWFVG
jgi:hypothetical protein